MNDAYLTEAEHGLSLATAAACFPCPACLGASDAQTAEMLGETVAEAAVEERIGLIVGPAVGDLSSEPVIAGELMAAMVRGAMSRGVGLIPRCTSAADLPALRVLLKRVTPWALARGNGPVRCAETEDPSSDELRVLGFEGPVLSGDEAAHPTERTEALLRLAAESYRPNEDFFAGQQHHMARRIARECLVLLKNRNGLVPLHSNRRIVFIGRCAQEPLIQSERYPVRPAELTSALEAVRSVCHVTYTDGSDHAEAVRMAKDADAAVIFAAQPDAAADALPAATDALIEAVCAARPETVVVLHNARPVAMPWLDRAAAVLEAWLPGQAGGAAIVDVLFGGVGACGLLAAPYTVGERTLFPAGYGLCGGACALDGLTQTDGEATVTVTLNGSVPGKVPVCFRDAAGALLAVAKPMLFPGMTMPVTVTLPEGTRVRVAETHAADGTTITAGCPENR